MDREHAAPLTLGKECAKGFSPEASTPVARTDVKIVDEAVRTAILHAVPQREHRVTARLAVLEGDPDGAFGVVAEQGREAVARPLAVQGEVDSA